MLECGPGLAEPFLLQEMAFLGKVRAQDDLLLVPLTIAVGCNVFSTPLMLKVWSAGQYPWHHLQTSKCSILGPLQTH